MAAPAVGKPTQVCVTGASGYIASELVRQLLNGGYHVTATVRNVEDPKKTDHLKNLENAQSNLTLKPANLLEPGSFRDAVSGASCVFHTASPFFIKSDNPEEELIKPAVDGTKNILQTCAEEPSVKRVVLTSSTAAVAVGDKDPSHVFTEDDFSDEQYMREKGSYYPLSKTLAERAAWDFVKNGRTSFDLVVMNPCLVIGPMLQPSLNTSSEILLQYLNGNKEKISDSYPAIVDVRDVARAHVKAAETSTASGRYILNPYTEHWSHIVNILRNLDVPGIDKSKIPTEVEEAETPGFPRKADNSKAENELGMTWTPLEQGIRDHVVSLQRQGYL